MNLLILDDDESLLRYIKKSLNVDDLNIFTANSIYAARGLLKEYKFDIVVIDYMLKGEFGFQFVPYAQAHNKRVKIVMITAFAEKDMAIEALNMGITAFLQKPFVIDDLTNIIVEHREKIKRCNRISI